MSAKERKRKSAKERKRKSAKEHKRTQKAKERKRVQTCKNCKQPDLKQSGLGTANHWEKGHYEVLEMIPHEWTMIASYPQFVKLGAQEPRTIVKQVLLNECGALEAWAMKPVTFGIRHWGQDFSIHQECSGSCVYIKTSFLICKCPPKPGDQFRLKQPKTAELCSRMQKTAHGVHPLRP